MSEHDQAAAHGANAQLPRLYCIVDAACFAGESDVTAALVAFARELALGGSRLIQYRDKTAGPGVMLSRGRELARVLRALAVVDLGAVLPVAGRKPILT